MNFKTVLALPKTAPSAKTYKSITSIWIVWSTLYVYLWGGIQNWKCFWLKINYSQMKSLTFANWCNGGGVKKCWNLTFKVNFILQKSKVFFQILMTTNFETLYYFLKWFPIFDDSPQRLHYIWKLSLLSQVFIKT